MLEDNASMLGNFGVKLLCWLPLFDLLWYLFLFQLICLPCASTGTGAGDGAGEDAGAGAVALILTLVFFSKVFSSSVCVVSTSEYEDVHVAP